MSAMPKQHCNSCESYAVVHLSLLLLEDMEGKIEVVLEVDVGFRMVYVELVGLFEWGDMPLSCIDCCVPSLLSYSPPTSRSAPSRPTTMYSCSASSFASSPHGPFYHDCAAFAIPIPMNYHNQGLFLQQERKQQMICVQKHDFGTECVCVWGGSGGAVVASDAERP